MKYIKSYHQINESRRVTAISLITRHREAVESFIEGLNRLVAERVEFCESPAESSREVTDALDNLVTSVSADSGLGEEETVRELARLFQGELAKTIAAIARPRIGKFTEGQGLKMSQEVVESISDHMIGKYGPDGEAVMQAISDLLLELQVQVEPFCDEAAMEPEQSEVVDK